MDQKKIPELRKIIDEIDISILSLLKRRLACAKEIGKIKETENQQKYDPAREQEILKRLLLDNNNSFPEEAVTTIFTEIIRTCRLLQ